MGRLGLVAVALAVAGCEAVAPLPQVTWDSTGGTMCTLEGVSGTLVDVDGHTAIADPHYLSDARQGSLFVRWPAGWQVRSSPGGLDVLDGTGTVRYQTGTAVSLSAAFPTADNESFWPRIEGGGLLVCPFPR